MKKILFATVIAIFLSGCAQLNFSNLYSNSNPNIDRNKPMTMFILDASGSMNNYDNYSGLSMIESAKKNIKDIALTLDTTKTNLMLLEFGSWCSVDVAIEPTNDAVRFANDVSLIKADGRTPLAKAIQKAGDMIKNSNIAVHIIIFSDGMETCRGNPQYEMKNIISQNPNVKISTFVLGYDVDSATKNMLEGLIYGGGKYFDVKDSAEIATALNSITTNLSISQSGWSNGIYNFNINFDHDSDIVKPEFYSNIQRLAIYLKQSNNKAQIQGHTDNIGDQNYNKNLSQRRADSVKNELIKLGVSRDKLQAVGYGESRPKVKNNTQKNRYENRRVEAHIF